MHSLPLTYCICTNSHTHTHTHTHLLAYPLSLSLSHTHTHTTHTYSLTHSLSLSLSHTHAHTHTHTHTLTRLPTHSLSLTLSLSLTPPPCIQGGGDDGKEYKLSLVEFGCHELCVWYASPYPPDFTCLPKIYICQFCLKYFKSSATLHRHAVSSSFSLLLSSVSLSLSA